VKDVTTVEEAARLLASPRAILFKHSPRCPVSAFAYREVTAFLAKSPDVPVHLVDVISHREVSRRIAEMSGVRHESPQILVVRDGTVAFHASHEGVTAKTLEREAG
jgi:bacillithiol system protein YtxJ